MRVKVHRRGQKRGEDKNIGISLWKGREVPFSTVWDRRTAEPAVIIPSTIVIIVFLFRTQYCIVLYLYRANSCKVRCHLVRLDFSPCLPVPAQPQRRWYDTFQREISSPISCWWGGYTTALVLAVCLTKNTCLSNAMLLKDYCLYLGLVWRGNEQHNQMKISTSICLP